MLTVDQLRLKFSYLIISVLWINALLVIIRDLWASDVSYVAIGGVLAVATSTTLAWIADHTGQATRIISSSALSMTVILLVFSFSGHPYQVEIHMYFFAVLAMTTGWCDWKASVACAGTTALHHLLLNFLLPAAIYPGGPDLARLMVHIATLLCELAIQIWICQMLNLVFATVAVSLSENEAQLRSVEALAGERDVRARAESERAELRKRETDRFTGRMHGVSETFAQTARELAAAAQKLSATADETSRQASTVSSAAMNASANVQTVAASTDEMSASIRQIADQVAKSSDVANIAANEAASTEKDVRALSEAASKIGEVVDLINTIAAQTNLLALNATIEAARAGESGRGFAIVAQEVKQLAAQTARATEEITTKVAEIQSATHRTVGSIDKIVGTVSQIQQISAGIGAAIAEQNLATDAIASSTNSAARGTEAVTDIIRDVDRAAEMTGAASGQLKAISDTLSSQSADLQTEVEDYVLRLQMA